MTAELPDGHRLAELSSTTRWRRVDVVAETGSTNADVLARIDAGDEVDGTVLISARQLSGRGRHARVWETPPGQLAISAAVEVPSAGVEQIGWLSLLTGLVVRDAITEVSGAAVQLKWPNDVLAPAGGKLAGILSEYRPSPDGGGTAVIGTGINLDLPAGAGADTAASISSLTDAAVDPTAVAAAYLTALSARLGSWPHAIGDLVDDYRAASTTLGSRVRLVLPGDTEVIGDAVDIDDEGRIIVDGPDGRVVASAGDVTHLRPAQ